MASALSSEGMSLCPDGQPGAAWPCFTVQVLQLLFLPWCQSCRSLHVERGLPCPPESPPSRAWGDVLVLEPGALLMEEMLNTTETFQCAAEFWVTGGGEPETAP